ncbi:MAG TPA: glycerate kinase [Anaerolineales bacterium]|nr:glycerate kinase [Anaerolineales bacterium]
MHVLAAALEAVDPTQAVRNTIGLEGNLLRIQQETYLLNRDRRVVLIGAGKAGAPMAQAVVEVLGDDIDAGMVIVKDGYLGDAPNYGPVTLVEAGHPIPDLRGIAGARRITQLLKGLSAEDLVVCLISGGGSALLLSPVEGVSLTAMQDLTAHLLSCGASIQEINTLRKHLDQVKGGQLAKLAAPARLVSLILSDVVGDSVDSIASGPTAPDPTTFQEALSILERYGLVNTVSPAIIEHLQRGVIGEILETPKPGDPLFNRVQNVIIASNLQAAQAAIQQAQVEGFHTALLSTYIQGEARQAGKFLSAIARQIALTGDPVPRPACLVAGGETTVTLQGDGLGGRNQELALSAAIDLAGIPEVMLVTLATDGGDGPTDAAGAVVTGETFARASEMGLDHFNYLTRNDAYRFFDPLGDLIRCGPTCTNVNDLAFIFAF